MRSVSVVCVLLLLPAIAAAQATVISGTASNWAPAYGVYAAPYVPLVTTPSVSLSTVSPSPVGASNATWGLVAGATNSTLSSEFVAVPSAGTYTEPVWYGPSGNEMGESPMHGHMHGPRKGEERGFDFVASFWSERSGVARAIGRTSTARKASRTYTNQDIDQMNQKTGTVKYNGKTEKL
jgi:hypothetical protein